MGGGVSETGCVELWGELSGVVKLLNGGVYVKFPSHVDMKMVGFFSLLPLNYPPGLCCLAEHGWS